MKYTNIQLQTYFDILNSVASKATGKLAYIIARNARKIFEELQEYTKIRNDKLYQYGEKKGDQLFLSADSPNYQKFITEMAEYDKIESE